MLSVESGGLFSPSFAPIGSSEPDTNSLLRSSLDSSPEYQLSLESPLSVFSPRSVSHTPRTVQPQWQQAVLATTYSTNTAKAKAQQIQCRYKAAPLPPCCSSMLLLLRMPHSQRQFLPLPVGWGLLDLAM